MDLITTPAAQYTVPSGSVVYPASAWLGASRGIAEPVQLVQYDDTLPILAVALYLNGQPYTLPEGAAVNIRMDKHDGHYVYNPALGVSEDRQTAYIGVTLQMTTVAGCFAPALEIVVDSEVAGTSNIPVVIAANQVPEDAVESTDEFKTIQQLVAEVAQAAQIVRDNAEGIQYVQENAANITAVAQNGENISAVGESIANVNTVAENLTPIQTAADNITAIQQAPTSAAAAASSATLSESWAVGGTGSREGEDTNNAKYYAEQAQSVSQGQLGWYATPQDLQAAHPTGQNGQWAIIGSTDTIWTWDSDTSAWVDSGSQVDLSNYYTKSQTNSLVSWKYTCTYDLDNWTASGDTDQSNGYPWAQTVTLTPLNPQAPTVTAESVFEPYIECNPTGVVDTDNTLRAALAIIANGNSTSGAGTITTIVQSKPVVDVPVIFTLKTEVQ